MLWERVCSWDCWKHIWVFMTPHRIGSSTGFRAKNYPHFHITDLPRNFCESPEMEHGLTEMLQILTEFRIKHAYYLSGRRRHLMYWSRSVAPPVMTMITRLNNRDWWHWQTQEIPHAQLACTANKHNLNIFRSTPVYKKKVTRRWPVIIVLLVFCQLCADCLNVFCLMASITSCMKID